MIWIRITGVGEIESADTDYIAVFQSMFFDTPGVHKRAVLAIQIEHEVLVEYRKNLGMMTAGATRVNSDVTIVTPSDHDFAFCQPVLGNSLPFIGHDDTRPAPALRSVGDVW